MRICRKCGTENKDDAIFCKGCSARLQKKHNLSVFIAIFVTLAVTSGVTTALVLSLRKGKTEKGIEQATKIFEKNSSKYKEEAAGDTGEERRQIPKNSHKEGERVDAGSFYAQVNGWKFSAGEGIARPGKGKRFVVVDFSVLNKGEREIEISSILQLFLLSEDGTLHNVAFYYPPPRFPDGAISPKKEARGNVAFEVPETEKSFYLLFRPDPKSEEIAFRLSR